MLLSIIELRIPCFDPRKSLPTPDYRPIIGGIRRNREMPFPLVLSDSRIREVNWIFISWNVFFIPPNMCNEHMECDAVMPDIISFNEERKSYINLPRPSISIPPSPPFFIFSPWQEFRAVVCTCSREALGGKKVEEEEKEEKEEE